MSTIADRLWRLAGVEVGKPIATGPVRATWNGKVLAESDRTVVVEGNLCFPLEDIRGEYFESSSRHTVCSWKGTASYYDVVVNGERNEAAAWYYAEPRPAAAQIKDHIAFCHGVRVGRASRT